MDSAVCPRNLYLLRHGTEPLYLSTLEQGTPTPCLQKRMPGGDTQDTSQPLLGWLEYLEI